MKPNKKLPKKEPDNPMPKPSKLSKMRKSFWVLEYQWKSKKDYNTYPATWFQREEYDRGWHSGWFNRYSSPKAAEDSIKKDLRSSFSKRHIMGRNWRVRNEDDGSIIQFTDIDKYYDK